MNSDSDNNMDNEKFIKTTMNDQFIGLLVSNQKRIHGFIRTMVPQTSHADDIMQDTAMIMWRKFNTFKPGSSFVAWGITIAKYRILKFRKASQKDRLRFEDSVFDEILSRYEVSSQSQDQRIIALDICIKKLNETDNFLINLRYEQGLSAKMVAHEVGRSIYGIYKSLARIHHLLSKCIKHKVSVEESL